MVKRISSLVFILAILFLHSLAGADTFDDIIVRGPWVDIRYFGATPNDNIDDQAAIQSAEDYAASLPTGGILYWPQGTYRLDNPIRKRPSVNWIGSGLNETILDSRAASYSIYADEALGYISIKGIQITHENNANSGVDFIRFKKGISRSNLRLRLIAKNSVTDNGVVIYGKDPDTGQANNNQFGNVIELYTETTDTEASGTALKLYGDDASGARYNANIIQYGRLDGFATGLFLNGNGNVIIGTTFNGPASTAAIHLYGNNTVNNTLTGIYLDSGITGDKILLESTATGSVINMANINHGVKTLYPSDIVNGSFGTIATVSIESNRGIYLPKSNAPGYLLSGGNASGISGQRSDGTIVIQGSPGATSSRLILSGEDFTGNAYAVSNKGGISASINDDPAAEFRVVKSSNASSFTKVFSITSSGAIRDMPMTNGPVGTLTWSTGSSTFFVSNMAVTGNSKILLFPANAAAAALAGSSKSPYISSKTVGSGFTIATGDGTNAAGTEMFNYLILN